MTRLDLPLASWEFVSTVGYTNEDDFLGDSIRRPNARVLAARNGVVGVIMFFWPGGHRRKGIILAL